MEAEEFETAESFEDPDSPIKVLPTQRDIMQSSFYGSFSQIEETVEEARGTSSAFLGEADLHFENALKEHIEVRGVEIMETVTSKYQFPVSDPDQESAGQTLVLEDVHKVASSTKQEIYETTTITQVVTKGQSSDGDAGEDSDSHSDVDSIVRDIKSSWGKPLGLPSPTHQGRQDNNGSKVTTPKRERNLLMSKNRANDRIRSRAESPSKTRRAAPIYVDLTYVPHHGNSYYTHLEFFKRIRARYYVFSGTEPSREVYDALLEAKQTWENKDLGETF